MYFQLSHNIAWKILRSRENQKPETKEHVHMSPGGIPKPTHSPNCRRALPRSTVHGASYIENLGCAHKVSENVCVKWTQLRGKCKSTYSPQPRPVLCHETSDFGILILWANSQPMKNWLSLGARLHNKSFLASFYYCATVDCHWLGVSLCRAKVTSGATFHVSVNFKFWLPAISEAA